MKLTATIAALAIGAGILTACGHDRTAQVACIDRVTQVRVDDWRCNQNNNDPNFMLWYLASNQSMFGYGQRAPYGSATVPGGYRTPTITVTQPPASTSPNAPTTPKVSTSAPKSSSKPAPSQASKPPTAKPPTKAPAAPKPKPAPARPR